MATEGFTPWFRAWEYQFENLRKTVLDVCQQNVALHVDLGVACDLLRKKVPEVRMLACVHVRTRVILDTAM